MNNQFAVPFNQESAMKAGGGDFVNEGGAYTATITSAKYVVSKNKGTQGMEFEIKTDAGQTAKYITLYYKKADGSVVNSGYSALCGMMFFLGLQGLTVQNSGNDSFAPELAGKTVGLFLQKVLYTKGDGKDGYKFEIKAPYKQDTMHTVKEAQENKQPATVQNWINSYQDKDDRKSPQTSANPAAYGNENTMPNSDDIPW